MWNFIVNNIAEICSMLLACASVVFTFLNKTHVAKSNTVYEVIQFALKMLPRFIAVSESANAEKDGATKKAFVMTFIENIFAGRGITITEDIRNTIEEHIDSIVKTTKEVNIDSKGSTANEENIRNDIDGITGLRVAN